MSIFVIADLHLSLGTDKPMDIFRGWDNYLERLEKNWRGIVNDDDTVVIPGDVSWAMKLEDTEEDLRFIHNLPGEKLILKGNHDLWWSTISKMKKFVHDKGFDTIEFVHNNAVVAGEFVICGSRGWFFDDDESCAKVITREAGRLNASIKEAKKTEKEPIVFLHYPPVYGSQVCNEIWDVLKAHDVKRVYYGHLHGQSMMNATEGSYDGVKLRLISADRLEFVPLIVEKF